MGFEFLARFEGCPYAGNGVEEKEYEHDDDHFGDGGEVGDDHQKQFGQEGFEG